MRNNVIPYMFGIFAVVFFFFLLLLHVFNLSILPSLQFSQSKINDSGKNKVVVMLVVCFVSILSGTLFLGVFQIERL